MRRLSKTRWLLMRHGEAQGGITISQSGVRCEHSVTLVGPLYNS